MLQITREQFTAAIEAGIEDTKLTEDERDRLRTVAQTADRAGNNFAPEGAAGLLNVGCPASQAAISAPAELPFAFAYDEYIYYLAGPGNSAWLSGVDVV